MKLKKIFLSLLLIFNVANLKASRLDVAVVAVSTLLVAGGLGFIFDTMKSKQKICHPVQLSPLLFCTVAVGAGCLGLISEINYLRSFVAR